MAAKIFRINYKSDFILTLNSDAGWMTPFCIKFWTGVPSQAFFAQWDGTTYTHCSYDSSEPTKLTVQFDDHHLPIGELKYQVAYHFTVADFPNDTEDEVINPANITTEIDGETYQVMLDFTGETAPEIEFSLPAYANESQRIANEQQRIANEQQRIQNEETRIAHEETRQQNEQQRIAQETARVNEFATLKSQSQAATRDANDAATLANQKAQLAADKAALADDAATLANAKAQLAADKAALANAAAQLANEKAALAQQKAEYAQQQGGYAKDQGDYAKDQGDYAKAQGNTAQADHERAESDHAAVEMYVDSLGVFDLSKHNAVGGVLATYADLSAALTALNALDSQYKYGGMSFKFVQSSDNKYVQYRLTANEFITNTLYWKDYDVVSTDNQIFSDLDISDEGGHSIVRFQSGHVKTKNFDSSKDATELERGLMSANDKTKLNTIEQGAEINDVETENVIGSEDLDISDDNGNVVLRLKNGNIKTKNFDSTEVKVKIQEDNTIKSIDGENPISVVKETPGLSAIIQDWGFIGDSLMSGAPNSNVVEVEDLVPMPNGRNFYKYSWGQMMCRLTGAYGTNYSNGGQTTKGWLKDYPGHTLDRYNSDGTWPVSFSTTHKVAYAISLGANDKSNFTTRYPNGVGDLQNVHVSSADYTENDLNTYAGCFGKIISLCKEVSPSSRVFIITTPNIESNILSDILTIQRAIANSNIFSHVYLVDLNAYMEDAQIRNIYGDGHLYCQGYMYYAYCVMTYIDYIIRQNPSDFANIQFIEYLKTDTGQI